jgi:FkbM family methyltransferase
MKILYGTTEKNIDITTICIEKLQNKNIITIPFGDFNRANIFTDPVTDILKKIFVIIDENISYEYDDTLTIKINVLDNTIVTISDTEINTKLQDIQSKLKINYGSFSEELPEQKMAVRYLTGSEKVLEIGGNIGRNSLIISYILSDNKNFVTLESDEDISKQLIENRDLNSLNFHIENSALSKRNLIQISWNTIESDVLLDGYKPVKSITLDELYAKYGIIFDTLVLDCEGAFYYILLDMPEILDNVNLIIMENDYCDINKKEYIDEILKQNNFYVDYQEAGGWGVCFNKFFEVWKKNHTNNDL